jgi:sugar phosphate permease
LKNFDKPALSLYLTRERGIPMKRHYAWVIAFTGSLVILLSHGFGRMSYSVILTSMKEGLSLNYTQVGLIGTGNFIGYLCLAILGGFLASRFGPRKVIFLSLLVMGLSLFFTGLAGSFAAAFFMRLITGMGNGGSYIPTMALPAAWFATRKRGMATGIATIGTGIGLSLSGLCLPSVISRYGDEGWRYAWYAMGVVVFACSFLVYALERDNPAQKGLTMYGGEEERKDPANVTLFSAWRDIVREKEIWKLGGVYFNYGFAYIIYLTFLIAYLNKELGFTPNRAGMVFSVLGIFTIGSGVIWGAISDVVGRRYGSALAYTSLGLASLLLVVWKGQTGAYVSAMLFGISISAIPVIMAAAAGDAVGGRLAPAGLGFVTLFFGVGQALGPAVAGLIKDTTGSFVSAFLLAAAICFLGAAGSLVLRKRQRLSTNPSS